MIDFVGRSQGAYDRARVIGQYMGEAEQRRQQRWVNREGRDEREREHQWNRTAAADEAAFYDQNAGIMTDYREHLAGLGTAPSLGGTVTPPSRSPAGQTSAAPAPGGAPAAAATAQPQRTPRVLPEVDIRVDMQEPIETRQYSRRELRDNPELARRIQDAADRGEVVIGNLVGGNVMVYPRTGSAGQPHLGPLYFPRGDSGTPGGGFGFGIDPRFTAGHLGMRPLQRREIVRDASEEIDYGDVEIVDEPPVRSGGLATIGGQVAGSGSTVGGIEQQLLGGTGEAPEVDFGPNTESYGGGLPPADAPAVSENYFGINNTSRGMQPTPEMQLISMEVRRNLRRAQLAARNGRREEADQAWAAVVGGQAGLLTLMRNTQLRAFRTGNFAAGADLLAQYYGYEPGSMQFARAPGTPDRFVLQVRTGDGGWTNASEQSFTFQEATNSMLGLVDAETAAANSEAAIERQNALIRAGADVQVARINANASLRDNITAILIAQGNREAEREWRNGNGEIEELSDGTVFLSYRVLNPATNRMERRLVELNQEEVRVPDSNGRRTRQQYVGREVTGIPGIGAN